MSFECVICGGELALAASLEVGEIVDCESCGVELELTSKDPVGVAVFEEEEK